MMEMEEKHVCKICEVENNDITNWVWICDKGHKRCAEMEFKSGDWFYIKSVNVIMSMKNIYH